MRESSTARPKASDLESGLVGVLVFESHLSHQVGVEIMEEIVWYPSEWKCECPHCEATNTCPAPHKNFVCTECGKAFAASVAHTEE